jgi:Na+/H+ antiporter NhaD/arsenite permease-like protein
MRLRVQFMASLWFRLLLGVSIACYGAVDAYAASTLQGDTLDLWWGLPFAGLLLSIALFPLVLPHIWHRHYGKIALAWTAGIVIPLSYSQGLGTTSMILLETLLSHYLPFIILIMALYVISGNMTIHLKARPRPTTNTIILASGALLANFIGTTGAAMLLIRPLLAINQVRRYKTHILIFFIFLVCNVGGCLTPLGDPPLFLGFLNGVSFFWVSEHLLLPFVTVLLPLLGIYWVIDCVYFRKEEGIHPVSASMRTSPMGTVRIEGGIHFIFLGLAVIFVLLSGVWHPNWAIPIGPLALSVEEAVRDIGLVGVAVLSFKVGVPRIRQQNGFSWEPLAEVAKLFAAIFITAVPVIAILQAGENGALRSLIAWVNKDGQPLPAAYFWLTGILSAFLDNAPTYLIFFNTAGGQASKLMQEGALTLTAISCGAVFMGALTYIGNAPNFMVKAIAETKGIPMPSFLGYLGWSCSILLPIFILLTYLFF